MTSKALRFTVGVATLSALGVGAFIATATNPMPPSPNADVPPAARWGDPPGYGVDTQGPDGSLAGDGTYVVGSDVQPGTYRTTGASDGPYGMCYWARLKDTDGEIESVIANDVGKGPQVVTIKSTDAAFTTRGCAEWTKP